LELIWAAHSYGGSSSSSKERKELFASFGKRRSPKMHKELTSFDSSEVSVSVHLRCLDLELITSACIISIHEIFLNSNGIAVGGWGSRRHNGRLFQSTFSGR
jgi:hypothetical protein